ncbi:MAG: hypothetical protein JSU81_02715 [Candidatus Coatesbacteria bacterium]|nr:MAG: hypothetical protein JSU81_02715 [Candidatus Coatesbacteria bacterium]
MNKTRTTVALVACWAAGAFATSYLGSVVTSWDATYSYPGGGKAPFGFAYGNGYMYVTYDELFTKRESSAGTIVDVLGLPKVPRQYPEEAAYDPDRSRIWCGCSEAGVYLLHPETGSYVASFPLPGTIPKVVAICYDRSLPSAPLWLTDGITWRIWNLTTGGSIVRSVRMSINKVEGLAFDNDTAGGPYLFVAACFDKPLIYALDPATGSVLYTFSAPVTGDRLQGLTWDGEYLWTNDSKTGYVLQFVAHEPNTTITPASVGRIRALFR